MHAAASQADTLPTRLAAAGRSFLAFVSFCVLFALLLGFQPLALSVYDESIILTGALHVLHGEVPGVDFYTVYGPLQFYVTSILFALFGENVFSVRVLYAFTLAVPVFLLTRLLTPRRSSFHLWLSLTFATAMVVFCSLFAASGYPNHSLLPVCVGLLCLKRSRLESERPLVFVLALSASFIAALLLRPAVGIVLVLTAFVALVFEAMDTEGSGPRRLLRSGGLLIAATLTSGACVTLVDRVGGGAYFGVLDIVLTIQSNVYPGMRGLPFPGLDGALSGASVADLVAAYLPPTAVAIGGIVYLSALSGALSLRAEERTTLLWLLALSCLLYTLGLVRTDGAHLLPALVFSSALGAFLLRVRVDATRGREPAPALRAVTAGSCLLLVASALLAFANERTAVRSTLLTGCDWREIASSRHACLTLGEDRERVLAFLSRRLEPGERIFSAPTRHDRIFINNMAYYALSGHLPATYWAHMDPGVQTTEAVQREMIEELVSYARVNGRTIAVVERTPLRTEPNLSAHSSGVHLLDEYLATCRSLFVAGGTEVRACGGTGMASEG